MRRFRAIQITTIAASLLIDGCGQSGDGLRGIQMYPPVLSWAASFASGLQSGPIAFQALGQTATLLITYRPQSAAPGAPFAISAGACVSAASTTTTNAVTIIAAAHGSCTITVIDKANSSSNITAIVP